MELDTGSAVSILSQPDFEQLGESLSTLTEPTIHMKGFSGNTIQCLGEKEMMVEINGVSKPVLLRVAANKGPSLLGRDILAQFTLPWKDIFAVHVNVPSAKNRAEILEQFRELFDTSTVGKFNKAQVTLHVDDSKPVFMKARTVPFSINGMYEKALEKLEKEGIIQKVEYSKWASPTVTVEKPDGSIRICGDYSRTINAHSDLEQHPLPTLDEILAKLSGGQKFTKLDLSQAYHQLELDPQSRAFTTISTNKGLFEYVRLPFGIHSAVSIFQRTMEAILSDIPGCIVYVDDILVSGKNDAEHLENLERVLNRLQEAGMKLKPSKFHFMLNEITYLGHQISASGITPTPEKVEALKNAKPPTSVSELQSFIGSATYLQRFIPRFADIMVPLYSLLKKGSFWKWASEEQTAFDEVKEALCSTSVLAHYSTDKDLFLQTDASGVGLGAVLFQREPTGEVRPVGYASRTLTKAEKNYSNIERESLALVYGATKFRQYLLGRPFVLRTDHRPLLKLFGHNEAVPMLVSTRMKKWRLVLSAYNYQMEYEPGKENVFADFMSRKPLDGVPSKSETCTSQVLFVDRDVEIVKAATVVAKTKRDPMLSQVLRYTNGGWPESVAPDLLPYFVKRWELTVSDGMLLWNDRVVIPASLRDMLVTDLHSEHLGAVRMKRLAQRYMWWPKIDENIETVVKECAVCQENAKMPSKNYATWSWPVGPWQRIHLDFAGPFMGKMFLVLVDAYSKFLDVIPMNQATSATTIKALQRDFALFGLPAHVVTDNGSQFTSEEFETFLRRNGIHHTCTAPGHPATNGLAERYVGHFKSKMKTLGSTGDLDTKLQRFLLSYRSTPTTNGKSPAELLMNRQPRLRFDWLKRANQSSIEVYEQNMDLSPEFTVGQAVFAVNFGKGGGKWVPAVIASVLSPMNYQVQVEDVLWKRHRNQLRPRFVPQSNLQGESTVSSEVPTVPSAVPTGQSHRKWLQLP